MDRANEVSLNKPTSRFGRWSASFYPATAAEKPVRTLGLSPLQRACKRIFDVVTAIAIFALFWWAMVGVAIVIRISTGRHVIFSHMRVGHGGRDFHCYKFRSMLPNSDELLADLLANDAEARAEWSGTSS